MPSIRLIQVGFGLISQAPSRPSPPLLTKAGIEAFVVGRSQVFYHVEDEQDRNKKGLSTRRLRGEPVFQWLRGSATSRKCSSESY